MATPIQRFTAIADALVNGTATVEQRVQLGTALARRFARLGEYEAADNAGKALIGVQCIRTLLVAIVRESAGNAAAVTASDQAEATMAETP